MASNLSQDNIPMEVSEADKNKVDNYNIENATVELDQIIDESAEMYNQLKKTKFNYLVKTCDLYSRIDFPSIMIEACRKKINHDVPKADVVEKGFTAN